MSKRIVYGGAYRICPTCGKTFYIIDLDYWAYAIWKNMGTGGKKIEFCSWGCLRKYEKMNPLKRQSAHSSVHQNKWSYR